MTQQIRVSFKSRGLRAPVYIVTSLSEPQWQPIELHSHVLDDNELEFWRLFDVEEGEYQYKFRLGPGDWWACDHTKPIVEDQYGNQNNIITVGSPIQQSPVSDFSPTSMTLTPSMSPAMSFDEKDAVNPLGISGGDGKQIYLRVGPAEPLTPPMTPDMAQKPTATTADSNKFQPFPVAEIQRPASAASDYSDKSIEEARPVAEEKIAGVTSIGGAAVGKQSRAGVLESIRIFLITLGTWMYNIFGGGLRATGILALFVGLAAIIYKIRDIRASVMPFIFSVMYPSTWGRRGGNDTSMV